MPRKAMLVYHKMEARSCNKFCSGKAIIIIYFECVLCVNSRRYPPCAPYCHLWPARLYNIFSHYLKQGKVFGEKSY